MKTARTPRWWQEIALVLIAYWLYSQVRNAIHTDPGVALRHGRAVEHLQERLGINFELRVNQWVAGHEIVAQLMDYYYATLHFAVTLGVLVWLFRARGDIYRAVRTVLLLATLVGLAGFYLYPLAPPRLLPQYGYIDTLTTFRTWGSLADPKIAERSNQFAAMPSLHVAWALWSGLALFLFARRRWVQIAGLCYPVGTVVVVIATANHFVLDAVGGAAALAIAVTAQAALTTSAGYLSERSDGPPATRYADESTS